MFPQSFIVNTKVQKQQIAQIIKTHPITISVLVELFIFYCISCDANEAFVMNLERLTQFYWISLNVIKINITRA